MRKVAIIICFSLLLLCLACLIACSLPLHTIDFVVDGEIYHTIYVKEAKDVKFPDIPTKEGCRFDDWFLEDKEFLTAFNESYLKTNQITKSFTAYGRWIVLETIGIKYQLLSDGTYEVIGYAGDGLDIIIPEIHDGKKVTTIGQDAFSGLSSLRTISIPPSISKINPSAFNRVIATIEFSSGGELADIGNYVFDNYKGQEITIPDSVKSIEPYAFYNSTNLASVKLPESLKSIQSYAFYNCTKLSNIILPESLTKIGDYAFSGCTSIIYLEIPKNVNSIGKYAFSSVVGSVQFSLLTEIAEIGDYAFADYKGTSLKIPSSVKTIYDNAFYNCSLLEGFEVVKDNQFLQSLDGILYDKSGSTLLKYPQGKEEDTFIVPKNVDKINPYAFSHAVVNVEFSPDTQIVNIGNYAFSNYLGSSISLPDTIKTFGKGAFANCPSLNNFTIPKSVAKIGEWAFSNFKGNVSFAQDTQITAVDAYSFENYKGTSIIIPESVTSIDTYAFSSSNNLTQIIIPENVTSINSYAFYNCTSLENIFLSESITSLGSYVFYNCSNLSEITIPKNVVSIGTNVFSNVSAKVNFAENSTISSIGSGSFSHYKGEEITLPESINAISSSAFYSCTNLLRINLPQSLINIGDRAFYNCTSLVEMLLPKNVAKIGSYAFSYVMGSVSFDKQTSINAIQSEAFYNYRGAELIIPDSVKMIGASAFSNCTNLTGIVIPKGVISIGDRAFNNVSAGISFETGTLISTLGTGAFSYYKGTNLTIPSTVNQIGDRVFYGCTNLERIEVEQNSLALVSESGVLYNKDMTTLIYYPVNKAGASYVVPNSVTNLFAYSFSQNKLESITISKNVTSIGAYSFSDTTAEIIFPTDSKLNIITSLVFSNYKGTQIVLPSSVNSIGQGAFFTCQSLTSITIDENNESYKSIDGVLYDKNANNLLQYPVGKTTNILEIPSTVEKVGQSAFSGNPYLAKVTIGDSVIEIGNNAFYNCANLSIINVDSNNLVYMTSDGVLYNKDGSSLIHYPANKNETNFIVPDIVTTILPYAFKSCNNLTSVTFTEKSQILVLDENAFRGCNNLSQVVFGSVSKLAEIGSFAFYGCSNLIKITIPESVRSIGHWAFEGCSSLQYEIYDSNQKYLGNYLIDVFDKTATKVNLKSTTIGIASYAFRYMSSLESLVLPESVKSIGYAAFEHCASIENIIFQNVNNIEALAFSGCADLKEITIIGMPPILGKDVFKNTGLTKIYVEPQYLDLYKNNDYFINFSAIIFPKE